MNNLLEYIRENAVPEHMDIDAVSEYLDVMQISVSSYDFKDIKSKFNNPIHEFQDIFKGYSRIGMSRLLNVTAQLMRYGRMTGIYDFWYELMGIVLDDIGYDKFISGVEFLVLELCTALIAGKDFMSKDEYSGCIVKLKNFDPYEKYDSTIVRKTPEELHNFCMYGICAEYLRGLITGVNTEKFILEHWEIQKEKFDEEGRYMDPGRPMVYDITSRYRLAIMLGMGYSGDAVKEMRGVLIGAAPGLMMQMSSDYKFPYGGRSNQFNFNESLVASMCEFYAKEFNSIGDVSVAGAFKNCAIKSISGLKRWLEQSPPRHIKNLFDADSGYGIDSYGTYERYMGTMGTFLTGAVLFQNNEINGCKPVNEKGGYVYETGAEFRKLFASCCGYSVEIDKNADKKYEASGLGRIHYKNAPAELALSMPFSPEPKYLLGKYKNNSGRAIGAFWNWNGKREYLAEQEMTVKTQVIFESIERVEFTILYNIQDRGIITENYIMNKEGVLVNTSGDFTDISFCVPILHDNGIDKPEPELIAGKCSVSMDNWVYTVMWDECIDAGFCDAMLYNRNGIYKELNIHGKQKNLKINLVISRSKT